MRGRVGEMKVYVHEKGITLTGKAWEIKRKLAEYARHFETVKAWIDVTNNK
jgi:hypothetical protein